MTAENQLARDMTHEDLGIVEVVPTDSNEVHPVEHPELEVLAESPEAREVAIGEVRERLAHHAESIAASEATRAAPIILNGREEKAVGVIDAALARHDFSKAIATAKNEALYAGEVNRNPKRKFSIFGNKGDPADLNKMRFREKMDAALCDVISIGDVRAYRELLRLKASEEHRGVMAINVLPLSPMNPGEVPSAIKVEVLGQICDILTRTPASEFLSVVSDIGQFVEKGLITKTELAGSPEVRKAAEKRAQQEVGTFDPGAMNFTNMWKSLNAQFVESGLITEAELRALPKIKKALATHLK